MSFAFPANWFNSQRNIQRAAAITLLLLIHVLALNLLMTSKQATAPIPRAVREMIVSFPIFRPKPVPQKAEPAKAHARSRSVPSLQTFTLPPAAIPPAAPPQANSIGRALFGCDPATQMNPDQQAGCNAFAAQPTPDEVGMPKRTRAIQTARWMHELEIKHSRRIVPCVGFIGPIFMVDVVCVAKGLVNGFGEPK